MRLDLRHQIIKRLGDVGRAVRWASGKSPSRAIPSGR